MYGVIIWSDPDVRKAVIWCEDNGYLAYYEAPEETSHVAQEFFDAGDYVEFEMTADIAPHRACNAQTLRSAGSPRVARTLQANGNVPASGEGARIIDLSGHQAAIPFTGFLADINRRG